MKQITETQFEILNNALVAELTIAGKLSQLTEQKDKNRAGILEIAAPLVTDDDKSAAPGVIIQTHKKPQYDPATALQWATQDENLVQCAPLLTVRSDMTSVLVGLFLKLQNDHPEIAQQYNLKAIFDLNKPAYEEACRMKEGGSSPYADIPYSGVIKEQRLAITTKNVKTGTELAEHFQIVPDEAPAPAPVEQPLDMLRAALDILDDPTNDGIPFEAL